MCPERPLWVQVFRFRTGNLRHRETRYELHRGKFELREETWLRLQDAYSDSWCHSRNGEFCDTRYPSLRSSGFPRGGFPLFAYSSLWQYRLIVSLEVLRDSVNSIQPYLRYPPTHTRAFSTRDASHPCNTRSQATTQTDSGRMNARKKVWTQRYDTLPMENRDGSRVFWPRWMDVQEDKGNRKDWEKYALNESEWKEKGERGRIVKSLKKSFRLVKIHRRKRTEIFNGPRDLRERKEKRLKLCRSP